MFKEFFDQQTLERANKFHNDIILDNDYRALEKKKRRHTYLS